ncbi:methyl-accepting chemotaxis protein [Allorhizobium undicola]|uniref:methyl-accepting chemotaxis protein n=1 Tax=Allorhizobium undicola TaxID=78527 RepID=UPI000684F9F6|nr:methyl-accepting chemotaxis protein [Allorhizobium undicola]
MRIRFDLSISQRVGLLAAISIAGLLLVGGLSLLQRQADTRAQHAAEDISRREGRMMEVSAALRDSLLWQRSFALGSDQTAVERFGAALDRARAALGGLGSGDTALAADVAGLDRAISAFAERFQKFLALRQQLGMTAESGLRGAMQEATLSAEAEMRKVESPELQLSMARLRGFEKDFLLQRDQATLERHAAEFQTFTRALKAAIPPGALRMKVSQALDVYANAFRIYGETGLLAEAAGAELDPAYKQLEQTADRLSKSFSDEKARLLADNEAAATAAMQGMMAASAAGALILLMGVWLTGRSISRPVRSITGAMRALADGDTAIAIPGLGRGHELGAMAGTLEFFRQAALAKQKLEADAAKARAHAEAERAALQIRAQEEARQRQVEASQTLMSGLERLAEGDLSFRLDEPVAEEFEALRHHLNSTVADLARLMTEIGGAADSIETGSSEIMQSVQELSRRTEGQAASLEETAAAVQGISTTVAQTSNLSGKARHDTASARAAVDKTGSLTREAVSAMQRIEHSSARISSIIDVINDISFQTNLLALNAGVEAARAGEAGKGFAVVAQEVRQLSQRSAQAAREIAELIDISGQDVAEGVRFVGKVGEALQDIAARVVAIDTDMSSLANATMDQSGRLNEITAAVGDMDRMTQQNAAMVEENTAATALLAEQAARLRQLLSRFHTEHRTEKWEPVFADYPMRQQRG